MLFVGIWLRNYWNKSEKRLFFWCHSNCNPMRKHRAFKVMGLIAITFWFWSFCECNTSVVYYRGCLFIYTYIQSWYYTAMKDMNLWCDSEQLFSSNRIFFCLGMFWIFAQIKFLDKLPLSVFNRNIQHSNHGCI